jgi:predicted flavoprotein YhiN
VEGGAIYALSALVREAILAEGRANLILDLRPGLSLADLIRRLKEGRKGESRANHLRKAAGLSPLAISLLREKGPLPQDNEALAQLIKSYSLQLTGVQSLQRAISTAGGVAFSEMDENLMISSLPGVFCCGEMLDWEAPTGGYLLQASFASANWAAEGAKKWLQNLK